MAGLNLHQCPSDFLFGNPSVLVNAGVFDLNSAYVHFTSGDAQSTKFIAAKSQTSADLVVYQFIASKTGSPTDIRMGLYDGPSGAMDSQRPSSDAAIASSGAVDLSSISSNSWATFTIPNVTLVAGKTYWLLLQNNTGTPASNYVTVQTRQAYGTKPRFIAGYTIDGYTNDGQNLSYEGPTVIKYSSGLLNGNPYGLATANASNTNYRGNRFTFPFPVTIYGAAFPVLLSADWTLYVHNGTTELSATSLDLNQRINGGVCLFNTPITFAANTAYDVTLKPASASTLISKYWPNTSPPADVSSTLANHIQFVNFATPGTVTPEVGMSLVSLLGNVPTPTASGGGGSYVYIS